MYFIHTPAKGGGGFNISLRLKSSYHVVIHKFLLNIRLDYEMKADL